MHCKLHTRVATSGLLHANNKCSLSEGALVGRVVLYIVYKIGVEGALDIYDSLNLMTSQTRFSRHEAVQSWWWMTLLHMPEG
jgi:hypothetical protein